MPDIEQPLSGGVRHGRTVRVGDTVRKPSGPWTPAVRALLDHLAAKNFPAPRFLGLDDRQREILTYIEGEPSTWPWPEVLRTLNGVQRVGAMLRRYHDAVDDFLPPPSAVWQDSEHGNRQAGEIVCHRDFGPYNLIWREAEIVGVIDWEWARPAPALRDVAYAAWMTVPLRTNEDRTSMGFDAERHARERLIAFMAGHGTADRRTLLEAVLGLQREYREKIERYGAAGKEPWKSFREIKLHERNVRDRAWLVENMDMLLRET
jgi:hypothetical protein